MSWHAIIALVLKKRMKDVGSGIPSFPLENTYGRTTPGVACNHRLWTAHMVERSWS